MSAVVKQGYKQTEVGVIPEDWDQHSISTITTQIIDETHHTPKYTATIGECAINTVSVTTNQGFKNIVPFQVIQIEFLYYLMVIQKKRLIALCGGSTFLEIGKKQLAVFDVFLPLDKSEQSAIASVLSDMDAEIDALVLKLEKARRLKQGMMHN